MGSVNGATMKQTDDEISAALALSEEWGFQTVFESGVEALQRMNLTPIRALQLIDMHNICKPEWIQVHMKELVNKNKGSTLSSVAMAKQIGIEFTFMLLRLQDLRLIYYTILDPGRVLSDNHFTTIIASSRFGNVHGA